LKGHDMELKKGEKIEVWDIIFETTTGRKFTTAQLGINLPLGITERVDELIADDYPCEWDCG